MQARISFLICCSSVFRPADQSEVAKKKKGCPLFSALLTINYFYKVYKIPPFHQWPLCEKRGKAAILSMTTEDRGMEPGHLEERDSGMLPTTR